MILVMVSEKKMLPIPNNIKVLNNWGYVGVVGSDGSFLADGDHVHLEGEKQAFIDWLKPFDTVWRARPGSSVMMQEFEAVHIK